MEFLIHAGRHKTGTTHLQDLLKQNASDLLNNSDVLYPQTGRGKHRNHHRFFKSLLSGSPELTDLVSQLKQEIDECDPRYVVMSSEVLSRTPLPRLKELQEALPYTPKILFYLRNQEDYLCSIYAERVKQGTIAHPYSIWDFKAELDYEEFLSRYISAFGSENIIVRSYDTSRSDLWADFRQFIGSPAISNASTPKYSNVRFSWLHISLLRVANRNQTTRNLLLTNGATKLFHTAAHYAPIIFDRPKPLTKRQKEQLRDNFSESNRRIAERHLEHSSLSHS